VPEERVNIRPPLAVLGDCCIAPCDDDHEQMPRMLAKVAKVMALEQFPAQ
jgi:hypothetical protein